MEGKLYYSISEVADMIGENVSLVRYWSNTFSKYIHPHRTAKGNRQYKDEDISVIKQIHHMVNVEGLTLDGVEKALKAGGSTVDKDIRVLESLKEIRSQLLDIKEKIN